jgi:hypothetical protein
MYNALLEKPALVFTIFNYRPSFKETFLFLAELLSFLYSNMVQDMIVEDKDIVAKQIQSYWN